MGPSATGPFSAVRIRIGGRLIVPARVVEALIEAAITAGARVDAAD